MMNRLFFFLLFTAFLGGCRPGANSPGISETFPMDKLTEKNLSETGFEVVGRPRYIALQPTVEKDQISSVDKVLLFGNKIYVADKFLKKLTVYDSTGRLQQHIEKKGHGPGEYVDISDFSIDPRGNIYVLDNQTLSLLKYDSAGIHLQTVKMPFRSDAFQCLSHGKFIFSLPALGKENRPADQLLLTGNNLKTEKVLLQYDSPTDENFRLSGFGFQKTTQGIFYHKPIDDHVYVLDESGNLTHVYYFDFGKRRVPESDKQNVESKVENRFGNYTTLTFFTIVGKKYIYLSLFDRGEYKQALVDLRKNIFYTKSDETVDPYGHFIAYCDSTLIGYIPNVFEGNIPADYPPDLKTILKQGNPVLCLYSIGENL